MPQLGFKNGVNLSPEVKDYLLKKNAEKTGGQFSPGVSPANNTADILAQLEQIKQRQANPEYLAKQGKQDEYGLLPAYISAMSKLSSSFGTLGGQTADTSVVDEFGKVLDSQQLARKAKEKESLLAQDEYDKTRLALADVQDKREQYNEQKLLTQRRLDAQNQANQERFEEQKRLNQMRFDEQKRINEERLALSKEQLGEQRRTNQERLAFNQQTALDRKNKIINEKRPTESQFNAALYGRRMETANDVIAQLANRGFDRTSYGMGLQTYLPMAMRSKDLKVQEQAERNFINAILRRESGAAISPGEFESGSQQYFPRAGDSSEVLANKLQNREQAIAGLKAASGTAWDQVPQVASTFKKQQSTSPGISETAIAAEKSPLGQEDVLSKLRDRANNGDEKAREYLKGLGQFN